VPLSSRVEGANNPGDVDIASFETSVTTNPATRRHTSEKLGYSQHVDYNEWMYSQSQLWFMWLFIIIIIIMIIIIITIIIFKIPKWNRCYYLNVQSPQKHAAFLHNSTFTVRALDIRTYSLTNSTSSLKNKMLTEDERTVLWQCTALLWQCTALLWQLWTAADVLRFVDFDKAFITGGEGLRLKYFHVWSRWINCCLYLPQSSSALIDYMSRFIMYSDVFWKQNAGTTYKNKILF